MKNKLMSMALAAVAGIGSVSYAQEKDIVDTAVGAGSFKTLATALGAAGLVETMKGKGPFTVFAPTDAAFAKLPAGTVESLVKPENKAKLTAILTHHVVKGKIMAADVSKVKGAIALGGQRLDVSTKDGVSIDGSKVSKADIVCSNGVIHVIDTVMMPATDTIPSVAEKAGSFKTLLTAVKAAGLAETLSGPGPFTVFAPTDEAFAKLGNTVSDLLKPENKAKLTAILTYHVVPGRIYSEAAVEAKAAKTVQGGSVKITTNEKGAFVDGAKILTTDIDASNGVIHVIDSVILPPTK
jgi:transforming growth factor-beta-induced protein